MASAADEAARRGATCRFRMAGVHARGGKLAPAAPRPLSAL